MSYLSTDEAYEHHDLACWYQSSVDDKPPIWTDEHLEELLKDFYLIPKDTPTADVVPKSEVEALKEMLDATIAGQETLQKALAKTKTEVAREIFGDIDGKMLCFFPSSSFVNAPHTTHYQLLAMLAELKKKYTDQPIDNANVGQTKPLTNQGDKEVYNEP